MSLQNVINSDELKAITGYQRPADAARCLREQGVTVFNGRRGPWTTIDLINKAGGIETAPGKELSPSDIL
ncbi:MULTISPECIES: hypothetical protein [Halomonadaceae]|uniref:DUF4224 domain-containing protein n=1 Tax=Vreelandella neptunia TaxID=115551 RepID=A0ABZ0YIA8_9GAMM|nr:MULTISPECIES: hypothetical protein [Halomonas]MBT2784775.1 hypothetical protein [Halomonas sp. ISL-106]MBT2796469.1 hypothetical protein [Halomonas sp. ISL-104]MDN3562146.1 hypothetical protein [Halomonas neptunia]OAL59719.1 hypothetical protein A6R74_00110 [Halomonas sp. ALS9]WQH11847.1 hypothetical protein SR894_17050 [Halomonas neptunia]|tara:strand:- start:1680 stop:1889 length:210 start_codon:yes stop_codon:yes gene_type:complete